MKPYLIGLVYLLPLLHIFSIDARAEGMLCNGSAKLCSKRYNEVTYPTAHNGQSHKRNRLFEYIPGSNINNQNREIMEQLKDGIRAIKVPLHMVRNTYFACHGVTQDIKEMISRNVCGRLGFIGSICNGMVNSFNPCEIDPATRDFKVVLETFEEYLRTHPNTVLTLFIEDGHADFNRLDNMFYEVGLYPYIHQQNVKDPWPTLQEMLLSNRRLVVFHNHYADNMGNSLTGYPIFNYTWNYIWQSRYTFRRIVDLERDDPLLSSQDSAPFLTRNDPPYNKLWILQHFTTPTIGGWEADAKQVNRASFLSKRVDKYKAVLGSNPNFIWVDFYEYPQTEAGVFSTVDTLNEVNL